MQVTKPQTWMYALRVFNDRNMSRPMDMQVITMQAGVQSEAHGLTFRGVAYDHHGESVEIMLGAMYGDHITHTMKHVTSVDVLTSDLPSRDALRIVHDGGQTLLTASQAPRPYGGRCETAS